MRSSFEVAGPVDDVVPIQKASEAAPVDDVAEPLVGLLAVGEEPAGDELIVELAEGQVITLGLVLGADVGGGGDDADGVGPRVPRLIADAAHAEVLSAAGVASMTSTDGLPRRRALPAASIR